MAFVLFYHSTSHIWSDGAFLKHHILLLLLIILDANHNMEHPASKYHPHHLEASRVFPAEHFGLLCLAKVPDQFCFFFSLGNKLLGHFCPSLLFEQSKEGQSFVSHLDSPSLRTGSSRFISADGTRALALPQIQLLPWNHSCTSTTPRTSAHDSKPGCNGQFRQQRPQGYCQVLPTSPTHTLQENPTYSFPTLSTPLKIQPKGHTMII